MFFFSFFLFFFLSYSLQTNQDIAISIRGAPFESEIRRTRDKQQLLRLLSHFANPGQAIDGHFPVNGPIDVPFGDIQCKFVKGEVRTFFFPFVCFVLFCFAHCYIVFFVLFSPFMC